MNYDHVNLIHDFWAKEYRPHIRSIFQVNSFDEYLKKISFTKSCKWLREMEEVKITRPTMFLDPVAFAKKYKDNCVSVLPPGRPEEGVMRTIYQFSPTAHCETVLVAWVENNTLNNYIAFAVCHKTDEDLNKLLTEFEPMRRTGNTEDKRNAGFAGNPHFPFPEKTVDK